MKSNNDRRNTAGGGSHAKPGSYVAKVLVLIVILCLGLLFVGGMLADGQYAFAMLFAIIIGSGLLVFSNDKFYPHRYIFPGVAGMVIFIIFPLVYTIYISFTNYSAKNLFSIERAEAFHLSKTYRKAGGDYKYFIYQRPNTDEFQLALQAPDTQDADGNVVPGQKYMSDPAKLISNEEMREKKTNVTKAQNKTFIMQKVNEFNGEVCSKCKFAYRDYLKLAKVKLDSLDLTQVNLNVYSAVEPKFRTVKERTLASGDTYSVEHMLVDNETNELFAPDYDSGYYRYVDGNNGKFVGDNYTPGFRVGVGFYHFKRIVTDPNISEPFVKIFIWTVVFSAGTVFITLAIGMVLACFVQWEFLKGRGFYRLFLILPYAVPSFISILVFKGLFNESWGEINRILDFFFGIKPDWFNEPYLARTMLLIVNAWLGYPYMMILCMGLLKSISDDLYEASSMDGANPLQNFLKITLPLLMKPLTPLLIASFAFNFNNFVLIMLLTNGGPDFLPEEGSTTASSAGATDLLVSYTYRLAFEGGAGGNDYGLASAIATAIFILVGALSVINLKLSKMSAKD